MTALAIFLIVIYACALLFIFSFSITQLSLTWNYLKSKIKGPEKGDTMDVRLPTVTVQLPIYNELYVAGRLIDCIAQLDYPADKLEIQVLDDSTDETTALISQKVNELRQQGLRITHVRRSNRQGYKAGALAYGLTLSQGDFIAIFDSDFLPEKDFLRKTIPAFEDQKVGVVQTRWDHLNRNYSLLTRLQAFGLDAHFSIEQKGRNTAGHFINFNGTAGIWRRTCITGSGGWQADTLTEDLDLSYRAQLNGWKFIYREDVLAPAELPVTIHALKNQQYRWNKGAAECVRKNLGKVFRNRKISVATKLHAAFHLMNSSVFIAIIITALLSVPMLLIKQQFPQWHSFFFAASMVLAGFLSLSAFYFTSYAQHMKSFPGNVFKFIALFPVFLSVTMGLSLHNALAVAEGYAGKQTSFVRTPKFNITSSHKALMKNKYLTGSIGIITMVEAFLSLYFIWGMALAFRLHDFGLFPFHAMLAFGFAYVSGSSLVDSWQWKLRNGILAGKENPQPAALN